MTTAAGAVASSRDGRTFRLEPGEGSTFFPGDVVVASTDTGDLVLGQVLTEPSVDDGSAAAGSGVVLGTLAPDGRLQRSERPSFSSPVSPASAEQLAGLQASTGADLAVGRWTTASPGTTANLRTAGFNRHTFLCGQSGSGKTYALGVLLERLMLTTDLRMVIVDPNADFVRLGETKPETPQADAARIGQRGVRVLRSDANRSDDALPLRLRFRTMARQAQAAVLQLDPVRDEDLYNAFVRLLADAGEARDLGQLLVRMQAGDAADRRLLQRIQNLGMTEWEAWAGEQPSAADVATNGTGVSVLDLGGFDDPAEPLSICLEVLDRLWSERESRVPTLLVIDEAHNLCRADPSNPVAQLVLERLIQIAAEGRKYGLWLLLSSQRPSKIHPQILSQCDNLMLMRMNSPDDIVELGRTFGFAPQAMLHASTGFVQGEALLAGGFAPVSMLARMRERLTYEGGSDVAVPLIQR